MFGCTAIMFSIVTISLVATTEPGPNNGLPPPCDSTIYCTGEILDVVQQALLYEDSKTFVDMKMKVDKKTVIKEFKEMMQNANNKPSKKDVKKFVDENFDPPGSEFELFEPPDWVETPKILKSIKNERFRDWAKELNRMWKILGRKIKKDVQKDPELYSIIYVPNAMVVPGGRFREFYYWDSYWVILGLLHSEMTTTVKGMLENFVVITKRFGLVPNGGRIYYTRRSQPPLLIPMMKTYYDATNDKKFIQANIETLEKEFTFWLDNRCTNVKHNGKTYRLAQYNVHNSGPRPESYREDMKSAEFMKDPKEKDEFYSNVKSACESGWDFSTRWFIKNGTNKGNLTNIKTRHIIPVDLNSIMFWNAKLLSQFYKLLANAAKEKHYKDIMTEWLESVTAVLWNDEEGIWLDYDLISNKSRNYFYASNMHPLWTGCYNKSDEENVAEKVVEYLKRNKIPDYIGGIPTSMEDSGEQWDFPNAWPPLVHIIATGLASTKYKPAVEMGQLIATRWVEANFKGYTETKAMFEKYDAQLVGSYGGGGEYSVQVGFGWTNGVCLDFLHRFESSMKSQARAPSVASTLNLHQTIKIAIILIMAATLLGTYGTGQMFRQV